MGYATREDVEAYLGGRTVPDDVDRLITRAGELVESVIVVPYDPTDGTDDHATLQAATLAQVEFWLSGPAEEHDIVGVSGDRVSIDGASFPTPPLLAPRARRALRVGGLGYRGVTTTAPATKRASP